MTIWSSVPRPSKCIGVAIIIVFGLVMVIFCLPLEDTVFTFYLPAFFVTTNDPESLSFRKVVQFEKCMLKQNFMLYDFISLKSSTISPYEVTNTPRSSNSILSDIIELTPNKSLKSATPLLVLDQAILMCTKDSNECEKLNKQKRFIFGIFGENTLSVDQTVGATTIANLSHFGINSATVCQSLIALFKPEIYLIGHFSEASIKRSYELDDSRL